jgi:hypothetical protein
MGLPKTWGIPPPGNYRGPEAIMAFMVWLSGVVSRFLKNTMNIFSPKA